MIRSLTFESPSRQVSESSAAYLGAAGMHKIAQGMHMDGIWNQTVLGVLGDDDCSILRQ